MKDHYRSQKMALWLNLVPDLQKAAAASDLKAADGPTNSAAGSSGGGKNNRNDDEKAMLEYRLYSELLPFVPNLKNIDKDAVSSGSTPASSEVLDQVPAHSRVFVGHSINDTRLLVSGSSGQIGRQPQLVLPQPRCYVLRHNRHRVRVG